MKIISNIWFIRILIFLVIPCSIYFYFDSLPKRERPKACERLVNVDGFVEVVEADSGMQLKLPHFANIDRYRDRGCNKAQSFSLDYLWYDKKLIPAYRYYERVKKGLHIKDHYLPVRIYFGRVWKNGPPALMDQEPWRFKGAIPHEKYPLEYYPYYYWDDPETPTKRSTLDHRWGIRNTQYKKVGTKRLFNVYCNIPALEKSDSNSRVKADFAFFGDSKCRGNVSFDKNGIGLRFMVDVWAYKNPTFGAVKEINLIYDALVEEIQTFIKE